jgi:pimeloyl-ACP methyl ester carboxylesterase
LTNIYGLNYRSAKLCWGSNATESFTLQAGQCSTSHDAAVYWEITPPVLQTTGYYFTAVGFDFHNTGSTLSLLPGMGGFSVTNTTPLLFAGIGSPLKLAGYAKQVVLNGDPTIPAYLGQYFDKAYLANPDGTRSTNETGILSEYGDFFPTDAGPVILTTKPDLSQTNNMQGECKINVIKLQLDVNHDGVMDLSFGGPDNTSQARPFVFWVNDDHDEPGGGGNTDQDLPVPPNRPDYTYGNIRCQRNLEDFAKLWVCGLPKLPPSQGYTVALSMSPSSGNPAINLYAAYGTNSGSGYLKDTNAAAAQFTKVYLGDQLMVDYAKSLAQISASQSYNLPLSSDGTPQFTNFLFEGVGTNPSSGQLTLTISQATAQGSNVLAQTSAWLDFHDIKDFYERAVITNITTGAISNWSSAIKTVQYRVVPDANESQDIVVFVHGINNTVTDWLTSSDTMFKRLYWSGYHGKFVTVHWPCKFLPWNALHPFDFNLSEFYGYKSATAFSAYLNILRTRYPNHRIHIVAHSQGNAVASEAISQGAPFDTCILTQAAMPASAFDVNAPTNADLVYADTPPAGEPTPQWQPMGYRGIYTNLTGQIINFFNTSDYALGWWVSNQKLSKPDGLPGARNYTSDGTNGYAILDVGLYRLVTDPEECRGMVSRARTFAIGAQGPVSGQTTQGVITKSVNLQTQFGFYDTRPEHSAEFTRPIQTVRPYYLQLLRSCQIQPSP